MMPEPGNDELLRRAGILEVVERLRADDVERARREEALCAAARPVNDD